MQTIIILLLLFVLVAPAISIMALNVLFHTSIQLSLETWFAAAWVHFILVGRKL